MKALYTLALLLASASLSGQTLIAYDSHDQPIANPERGWFFSVGAWSNNNLQPFPTLAFLDSMRASDDKVTLLRRYYLLDDFISSPIGQSVLDEFERNCDSLRVAGYKLIPRFTYNFSQSLPQLDASVGWTHYHLNQLKPYFENNKDMIAHVEAGFVGHYGEWHDSSEEHIDNFTLEVLAGGHQILDSLLKTVPPERMVATRYFYWNKMKYLADYHDITGPLDTTTALTQNVAARIGTHNDAVMYDPNWMWHHLFLSEQISYATQDLRWVVSSGEPLPSGYTLANNPIPQLSALYFNSLAINANNEGSNAHYAYWKQQGYFDDMTLHLGYRYRMLTASVPDLVSQGEVAAISVTIENTGYASPYNFRKTEIVLRNTATAEEHLIELTQSNDMRYWHTGVHQLDLSFEVPPDVAEGTYEVFLNFPDADAALRNNPAYSVQLANVGTWEAATGYNSLLFQLTIGGGLTTTNQRLYDAHIVYPNPTSSFISWEKASEWFLADATGRVLKKGHGVEVDMRQYDRGLYYLKTGSRVFKLVKN